MINILTFKNNGSIQNIFQPYYTELCKRIEQQIVLRVLSQALHQSLRTYSECLTELKNKGDKDVSRESKGFESNRFEIVIESEDLYIEQQQNKAYITEQIQQIVQTEKLSQIDLKMGNQNQSGNCQLENVKIDPLPLEVPIIDFKLKKKYHKKTFRSSTSDQSNCEDKPIKKSSIKVQEVNIVEDCDIPNFFFSNTDLQIKIEQLLQRKVDFWPENNRSLKHKRQLRNLE